MARSDLITWSEAMWHRNTMSECTLLVRPYFIISTMRFNARCRLWWMLCFRAWKLFFLGSLEKFIRHKHCSWPHTWLSSQRPCNFWDIFHISFVIILSIHLHNESMHVYDRFCMWQLWHASIFGSYTWLRALLVMCKLAILRSLCIYSSVWG